MTNRRGRTAAGTLAALVLAVASGGTALADAASTIEPRLDRRAYAAFLEDAAIDRDQRTVCEMLYSDYAVGFDALCTRTDQAAEDAGRSRVDDAMSGRVFIEPSELRRLRIAVREVERDAWAESDRLLEQLIADTEVFATNEPAFDAALRALSRAVYLHPRRSAEQDEQYAGDGLDVVALVREASVEGGELEALDPADVAGVLDDYATRLHQVLMATADDERRLRHEIGIARIERDRTAQSQLESNHLAIWSERFRLHRWAATRVGEIAEARLGPEARERWRARFDAATYPRLFAATGTERRHAWILRRANLGDVHAEADRIFAAFRIEYAAASREAAATMLDARLNKGLIIGPHTDGTRLDDATAREVYQSLLRNSGRRSKLDVDASAALEALLTDKQRKQLRADLAAAAHGRRR